MKRIVAALGTLYLISVAALLVSNHITVFIIPPNSVFVLARNTAQRQDAKPPIALRSQHCSCIQT